MNKQISKEEAQELDKMKQYLESEKDKVLAYKKEMEAFHNVVKDAIQEKAKERAEK